LTSVFFTNAPATNATPYQKIEREQLVLSSLPDLSVQSLDQAREHGRVSIGDMVKITGTSRNTLKEHFGLPVQNWHLAMHGKGRGVWYSLQ